MEGEEEILSEWWVCPITHHHQHRRFTRHHHHGEERRRVLSEWWFCLGLMGAHGRPMMGDPSTRCRCHTSIQPRLGCLTYKHALHSIYTTGTSHFYRTRVRSLAMLVLMFGWVSSWCIVEVLKMKCDQDLCLNLRYDLKKLLWQDELNPRVRCAFGNVF